MWFLSRWWNYQEHQRAVSCPRGAPEKPAAQHRPQRAHLLHPRHPSAVGKGSPADRWENWGRWSVSCPLLLPLVLAQKTLLSGLIFMSAHVNAESCWVGGSWWPAGCHQRLNMKNPSNGLNGVHQRPALPSDLACWLPLNTSVVSHSPPLPFLCSRAQEWGATAASVWIPTTKDQPLLLNSKVQFLASHVTFLYHFHVLLVLMKCNTVSTVWNQMSR